jgi:hypothetical protein
MDLVPLHNTGHLYVWPAAPVPYGTLSNRLDLVKQLTRDERQMIDGRRGLTIQFEGSARQDD